MSLCVRRWIPLVAVVIAGPSLAAQEPRRLSQPDAIPLELVVPLLAWGGFGAEPQILVGMLPGWMNSRVFLPPNGRVVGSAFGGSVTLGVLAVPEQPPEVAIVPFKSELLKLGWKALPEAPSPPPPSGGGFQPAPVPPSANRPPVTGIMVCGDEQVLMVQAVRRGTATQILYRVTPMNEFSTCNPQYYSRRRDPLPYPTLIGPAEATDFRNYGHCLSNGQPLGTSANFRTPMSLDTLMKHYAKQMQDSGWRPTPATSSGRTWVRTDSAGKLLEARLTVSASPQDSLCRDLNLTVWEIRKP